MRYFKKRKRLIIVLIMVCFLLPIYYVIHTSLTHETCPLEGPGSLSPKNIKLFKEKVSSVVSSISAESKRKTENTIVCTFVNGDAAEYNLPIFIKSISTYSSSILPVLIIFCVDVTALTHCHAKHVSNLCIFMDIGITSESLSPVGNERRNKDYFRLTYGRLYATLTLHKLNINVMPVDVDALFLQNPFDKKNGIIDRINDIAVVSDIKPFLFSYKDKTPINGGFLYLPGFQCEGAYYTRELLDKVWENNCHPEKNEQLKISSILRYMTKKYYYSSKPHKDFTPHMLPVKKYLNFCSTKCGENNIFSSILSIEDLHKLESENKNSQGFNDCSMASRKEWVYFHVACGLNTTKYGSELAYYKAKQQNAILTWVSEAYKT